MWPHNLLQKCWSLCAASKMQNESCSVLSHGHLFSLQFWPIHTNSQLGWSFLCPSGWKNWTDSSDKEESQVLIIIRWILLSASALFLHFSALTKSLNLLLVIPLHGITHHSTSLNMAKKTLNIKNRQEKVNIHWRKHFFICFLWSATENFAMNAVICLL